MLLIFSVNKACYCLLTFAVSTGQEMVTKKSFQGRGFFAQGKWTFWKFRFRQRMCGKRSKYAECLQTLLSLFKIPWLFPVIWLQAPRLSLVKQLFVAFQWLHALPCFWPAIYPFHFNATVIAERLAYLEGTRVMSCVSLRYYSAYVYIADLKNKKASLETSVQRAQRDVEKLAEPQVALLGLIWKKNQFSSFVFSYSFFWYCLEFLQLRCRSHNAGGISKRRFYSENVWNVFRPRCTGGIF